MSVLERVQQQEERHPGAQAGAEDEERHSRREMRSRLKEDYGPYYTNKFMAIHPKEVAAFRLLDMGRIAYSDNLTGTEFQRALKMSRTVDNTRE